MPFPLSQDFAHNHSLTPAVGEKDILAFGLINTFKILSKSDLTGGYHMGNIILARGGIYCKLQWETLVLAQFLLDTYQK